MPFNWPWAKRPGEKNAAAEKKQASGWGFVALHAQGEAVWTRRDYAALAREGFMRNPVAHRAVRLISEAAAAVPWLVYEDGAEHDGHPLLDLLDRPNPRQAGGSFMEALYGHLLLAGNAYVEMAMAGAAMELHLLRPDRVSVVEDASGWPVALDYAQGGKKRRVALGSGAGGRALQLSLFHPLDDHYGFAPLEAALMALDTHNAAGRWNKALLDNSARPSGALVYAPKEGGNLTEEQFDRLKAELEQGYSGPGRAGKPLVLDGGLDWKAMGLTPKDMDFVEAKNSASRDIALAFGVPPMLLGIPGDNTYANYQEANRAFYRLTVLPLVARTAKEFSAWLAPVFGEGIRLWFDADRIEGLAAEREALWARVGAADFLTDDEKREAVGYRPLAGARGVKHAHWQNQPRVPAGDPDGGQWTDGGGVSGDADGLVHLVQAEAGQGYGVDLHDEEAAGGHAIRKHVGRSPGSLLEYVQRHQYRGLFIRHGIKRQGSFPSVAAANKLVNSTLSRNSAVVDKVARGEIEDAFVTAIFGSETGIEAYTDGYAEPYLRDTHGVGVYIVHDPSSSRGFRVITAFPRND